MQRNPRPARKKKTTTSRKKKTVTSRKKPVTKKKVGTTGGKKKVVRKTQKRAKRFTERRLDKHKFVNPFSNKKKYKTKFGEDYERGTIPARIHHSTTKMSLLWDTPIEKLRYDPLLVSFTHGLRETSHPYVLIAKIGYKELLEAEGAKNKAIPVLSKVTLVLRQALLTKEKDMFLNALEATMLLSNCVGSALNKYVNGLLIQINKKIFDRTFEQQIMDCLGTLESNGGPDITKVIKAKVPTFMSMY